ncbi:MAG: hypothetical protein QOJ12_3565 [Thermoleophilales bacterium]|nr:hypothetical protein [Thermoleophilales bacterium]
MAVDETRAPRCGDVSDARSVVWQSTNGLFGRLQAFLDASEGHVMQVSSLGRRQAMDSASAQDLGAARGPIRRDPRADPEGPAGRSGATRGPIWRDW